MIWLLLVVHRTGQMDIYDFGQIEVRNRIVSLVFTEPAKMRIGRNRTSTEPAKMRLGIGVHGFFFRGVDLNF